jgi:hypothetical protein
MELVLGLGETIDLHFFEGWVVVRVILLTPLFDVVVVHRSLTGA